MEMILTNETNTKTQSKLGLVFFIRCGFASGSCYHQASDFSCFLHSIQAREDGLSVIQPQSLSFVKAESPSGKIIYNITVPLHPNQGKVCSEGVSEACCSCLVMLDQS